MKGFVKKADKWQGSPESIEYKPGPGPFLTLLVISAVGIVFLGFLSWYIPTRGFGNIHPALPYITGALLLGIGGLVLMSAALITLGAVKGRIAFYSPWLRWMLVKVFLPLMVMFGGIFRVPRIRIEKAFIDINNQMVRLMRKRRGGFRPGNLLILMPHCIQYDGCKIKVTRNVKNCAGCGRCEIGELVGLSDELGVSLFISLSFLEPKTFLNTLPIAFNAIIFLP